MRNAGFPLRRRDPRGRAIAFTIPRPFALFLPLAMLPAFTMLLTVAMLLPRAATAADDAVEIPLDVLLSRHLEWLGGREALDRVSTITVRGSLEASGLSGTFQSVQRRDGFSRADIDLGVVKVTQIVTPDSSWSVDGSGRIEPMGASETRLARRALAQAFGGYLLGTDGSTREDLGREVREGHEWRVVRFAYPDGDAQDLFLDPSDGSYTWIRERRDYETIWQRHEDWRRVDGVRLSFRMSETHPNPVSDQTLTIEELSLNGIVAENAFAPPRGASRLYSIEGGAPATDWLPVTLHRGAYVWVGGRVNGVEVDVLLDSGAGMTVLDRAFADSMGIATAGEVVARGTVGESSASFARGVTVQLGTLQVRDLSAAVIDLSMISDRLGRPLPVIFGKEVFHSLVVDLDYPARRIRFLESATFQYDGPGRRLPIFPAEDGHKEIEITVEDLPAARVRLDTGSGSALDLYGPYVEANRLLDGRERVSAWLTGGVGGMATEKVTSLRSVGIAGYTLRDVPIGIAQTATGAFASTRGAGNLGAGILKRFRVLFHYGEDSIWLEPRPGAESDPFERDRSGLVVDSKADGLEVLFVAPGSPAEATGWKAGERIVAIDGKPAGTSAKEEVNRFGYGPDGAELRLALADGSERTLTLARYY